MSPLEIVLLIFGGIIFILSFVVPVSKEEASAQTKELARDEIKKMVSEEMDGIKNHVDDAVDGAVEYAMEKTERSLERLSNEKIMAVSDYSDTVLQEIHKNHEEVMFLYDMLNDKHTNLKNTVSQVNMTVKAVEESTREAEAAVSILKEAVNEEKQEMDTEPAITTPVFPVIKKEQDIPKTDGKEEAENGEGSGKTEKKVKTVRKVSPVVKTTGEAAKARTGSVKSTDKNSAENVKATDFASGKLNRNEEILKLHEIGKSNVAIAKQLGLGVGEVKLVIELYKNS